MWVHVQDASPASTLIMRYRRSLRWLVTLSILFACQVLRGDPGRRETSTLGEQVSLPRRAIDGLACMVDLTLSPYYSGRARADWPWKSGPVVSLRSWPTDTP